MRAGKLASIVLWLILVGLALGAGLGAGWIENQSVEMDGRLGRMILLSSGAFALILLPLGYLLDRSLGRLQAQIEQSSKGETGSDSARQSRWLDPLTRSLVSSVDRFRQREQGLRNQLRDLEIRHRVSEAERRLTEAVLNSLRDTVIVTDRFMEIVMVNEAAARTFGFDLDAAQHRPVEEVLPDERLCQLISDAREAGNPFERRHLEHEMTIADAGGGDDARAFDVTLACFENHKHEVGGVLAVLHDQTHEREVSRMKSEIVSNASHELRSPLTTILGKMEMLLDGEVKDPQDVHKFYTVIQEQAERLLRLVENMLDISQIEAGIFRIDRNMVDIGEVIERAVETISSQAKAKAISISPRVADVGLAVEGDGDKLYRVVLNLLSNAVKYTPDGGRVTVSADSDNLTRSVVVTVTDTGLGIPPDDLPRLFEKFYRIESYKRVAKGTGLGLSLCKQIVETVHNGQIGVESKMGMGSKFWFSVPMRYAGSQAAA